MKDFYHLFTAGIQEMYSSEHEIIKALPKLVHGAKDAKLKEALRSHLEETKNQAQRLEEIADELKIDLKSTTPCPIMHALLQKGQKCASATWDPAVKDVAIIAAAQCVEHHEIAAYGTLRAFARVLKLDRAEEKLEETLKEEQNADCNLSKIAEGSLLTQGINKKASEEDRS